MPMLTTREPWTTVVVTPTAVSRARRATPTSMAVPAGLVPGAWKIRRAGTNNVQYTHCPTINESSFVANFHVVRTYAIPFSKQHPGGSTGDKGSSSK